MDIRNTTSNSLALILISLFFNLFSLSVAAELISPFENAEDINTEVYDYVAIEIPIGPIEDYEVEYKLEDIKNILSIDGKAVITGYELHKSTSQFEFATILKKQVESAGFEILFTCSNYANSNGCGSRLYRFVDVRTTRYAWFGNCGDPENSFFLSAKFKRQDGKHTFLFVCNQKEDVYQVVIEERDINFNKITINTEGYRFDEAAEKSTEKQHPDAKGATDHPLVSRFKHSYIDRAAKLNFVAGEFPIGKIPQSAEREELPLVRVEGRADFISYVTQKHVSQLEVQKNYLAALEAKNAEILFYCEDEKSCGDGFNDFAPYTRFSDAYNASPSAQCSINNAGSLTARIEYGGGRFLLFYCFEGEFERVTIHQTIIEEKRLELDKVVISADKIKSEIQEKGKVAIYGILFDHGSAAIKPESKPAFEQISQFLKQNATTKLYVVGHTDNSGSEQFNQELSLKRAESVVQALTKNYAIAQDRLHARGVGTLVPVATNRVDEGRQQNRRVELVEL